MKIRDRGAASDGERIRFTSAILPLWARRTKSLDALLPVLYLRGISTGDFQEALAALLGKDAPNLSPAVISRLTARVAGRVRPLAEARSVGAAIRVCVGGRCLPAGSHGRPWRMHAGADRRDAGGQEGTDRLPGWRSRERAELARTARRCKAARVEDRPGNRRWRRRTRLLEGARRGLSRHAASAVLGAQDRERVEQGRAVGAGEHEEGSARGLDGA